MQVIELALRTEPTPDKATLAHLNIDGTEYMLLGGTGSCTVLCGRWCRDRRSLGKTFWSPADIAAHYKKHGEVLAEYASKVTAWDGRKLGIFRP